MKYFFKAISKCLVFFLIAISSVFVFRPPSSASSEDTFTFQSLVRDKPEIHSGVIRFDFGTTTPLDDKYAQHGIEHTFTLINNSSRVVSITELKPISICVKKFYLTDGQHTQGSVSQYDYGLYPDILTLPAQIAPGAQIKVFVSIDPMSVFTGVVDQSVEVMVQGQEKPAAVLEMSGVLQSGISFSSSTLNFGRVPAGKKVSLFMTITLDRRLHRFLPDNVRLKVISNNGDIQVTKAISAQASPKKKVLISNEITITSPKNIFDDFPTDTKVIYKVTLLPNAELGDVKGSMSIIAPAYPSLIMLVNARVPFVGEVIGDISASPQVIVFDSVPVGSAATKSITVTLGNSAGSLSLLCHNPNLTAHLVSDSSFKPSPEHSGSYTLQVTLGPTAPVGVLEDKITVVTSSGQHLIVPVFASVSSK